MLYNSTYTVTTRRRASLLSAALQLLLRRVPCEFERQRDAAATHGRLLAVDGGKGERIWISIGLKNKDFKKVELNGSLCIRDLLDQRARVAPSLATHTVTQNEGFKDIT